MSKVQWPSERIPHGGIFHPRKVNHNPETTNYLKLLINESKMASMQRKNYDLRSEKTSSISHSGHARRKPKILIKPCSPKRRTFNTILSSGAYTREQFVPEHPKVDREAAKIHLQDLMAYGKKLKPNSTRGSGKNEKNRVKEVGGKTKDNGGNRFDQIQNEIKEREDFLKEMEILGEGAKYKQVIQQQIQSKIREMKVLKAT